MNDDELHPIRIIVADRGHVWVCRCPDPTGAVFWLTVTHARTIGNWGTTKGLGELYDGPTSSTQLHAIVPEKIIPVRAIIDTFIVREDKWANHLSLPSDGRKKRSNSSKASALD